MKIKFIIPFCLLFGLSFGQVENNSLENFKTPMPDIIQPSPSVAALMKFEEVQVDYYTGSPSISVPLFAHNFRGLNYDLTLNYNPSGVRVDEISTWVGTGWSLNEGGAVSRTVVGLPDERKYLGNDPTGMYTFGGVFHNDYFDFENLTDYEKQRLVWGSSNGNFRFDVNMDVFQFNFFGRTGRFHVIKNNQGNLEAKIIGDLNHLKIELFHNTDFVISKFIITDEKGFKYTFDAIEQTQQFSEFASRTQLGSFKTHTISSEAYMHFNSAWKITKVETPNNELICEFTYLNYVQTYSTPYSVVTNEILNFPVSLFSSNPSQFNRNFNDGVLKPKLLTSWNSIVLSGAKIQQIDFFDNSSIVFNTTNHPEGGYQLSDITINNNDVTLKSFTFNSSTNNFNRLFLDEVVQNNGLENLKYSFDYFDRTNLEGKNSLNRDDFGYFNGGNFKDSNKNFIKYGVLNKIQFPTGGVKEFEFEPNTYGFISGRQLTKDELFANSDNQDLITVNKSIVTNVESFNFNNSEASSIIVYIRNDQEAELLSSIVSGNETYLSQSRINITPKKLKPGVVFNPESNMNPTIYLNDLEADSTRTGVGFDLELSLYTYNFNLKKGFYVVDFQIQNQLVDGNMPNHQNGDLAVNLSLKYKRLKTGSLSKFLYGGGLRIKSIKFTDEDVVKDFTQLNYNIENINPNDNIEGVLSSGSIDLYSYKNQYNIEVKHILSGVDNTSDCGGGEFNVQYKVTTRKNPLLFEMTKGSSVGYKKVTFNKIDSNNETNGRIENYYSSPIDFSLYPTIYGYPYPPVLDRDFMRGNLIESKTYSKENKLLKKSIHEYEERLDTVFNYLYVSGREVIACPFDSFFSEYYFSYTNYPDQLPTCPDLTALYYFSTPNCNTVNFFTKWSLLTKGKAFLKSVENTEYFYSNSVVNATTTLIEYEYNQENFLTSKEKTTFQEGSQNQILETIYSYPIGQNSNTAPLTSEESNAVSKLIQLNRVNEPLHVKTIKNNVSLKSVATTYKEFSTNMVALNRALYSKDSDTNNSGGMNGTINSFVTAYQFNQYDTLGNPLEVQQENGMPIAYIWGYNQTQPIAKIENATYAQVEQYVSNLQTLSNGNNEQNLINALNNLRTALPNAMVTTYTYKPLVGISTVTDPKGDTQTYHYDSFNRLQFVKDKDGNILSENQYHYRTQN